MSKVRQLPAKVYGEKKPGEIDSVYDKSTGVLLKAIGELVESIKNGEKITSQSEEIQTSLKYFLETIGENGISNENHQKIEEILSSLQCEHCKERTPSTQFNCRHAFCDTCIEENYKNQLPPSALLCFTCNSVISPVEISYEFSNSWSEHLKTIKNHCKDCGSTENLQACGDFCDNCLCERYRTGNMYCTPCNSQILLPEELKNREVLCSGCKNFVFFLGDYTKTTECNHIHCYNCLKTLLQEKQCQCCKSEIQAGEEEKITNFIYKNCEQCKNFMERPLLIAKYCCHKMVCGACQSPYLTCQECETPLSASNLLIVSEFASIQRSLD